MVIVGLSVVVTVLVLQFHHHDPQAGKMPRWVHVILLNWCAWFLRMRKPGENKRPSPYRYHYQKHCPSISSIELSNLPGHTAANGSLIYCGYHTVENPCCRAAIDSGGLCNKRTCPSIEDTELVQNISLKGSLPEMVRILEEVQYIAQRFREQDAGEEICSEWKFAAAVIDRLCLVAFSLFAIICTITVLMSAPNFIEAVSKDFT